MNAPLQRIAMDCFIVLGRAGIDLYADPPGTQMEDALAFSAQLGGSAANTAAALSRLGSRAALLTRVSDDAVGRYCLRRLDEFGIDRRHVRVSGGELRTSLAVVETRLENCQSVIYRNGAADFDLTVPDVETVDFSSYGALVLTGTAFARESSRSAALTAISLARKAGAATVLDVDYRPYSWTSRAEAQAICLQAARACDIVVGNDVEFALMAGEGGDGLAVAGELAAGAGRICVYKMGEHGAHSFSGSETFRTGIYRTQALKPTGAGDAFLGGFLNALARGVPLRDAVLRGSANAAIVVSRVGCSAAMPTGAELDDFLQSHSEPQIS
jgi:5-dehydro-2-deoxygluconokinase